MDFFTNTDPPALLSGLEAVLTLAMPVGAALDSIEQIQRLIYELGQKIHRTVMTEIPKSLNEQIRKLGLAALFAKPPGH